MSGYRWRDTPAKAASGALADAQDLTAGLRTALAESKDVLYKVRAKAKTEREAFNTQRDRFAAELAAEREGRTADAEAGAEQLAAAQRDFDAVRAEHARATGELQAQLAALQENSASVITELWEDRDRLRGANLELTGKLERVTDALRTLRAKDRDAIEKRRFVNWEAAEKERVKAELAHPEDTHLICTQRLEAAAAEMSRPHTAAMAKSRNATVRPVMAPLAAQRRSKVYTATEAHSGADAA